MQERKHKRKKSIADQSNVHIKLRTSWTKDQIVLQNYPSPMGYVMYFMIQIKCDIYKSTII
jgi:hypothetical protein